jgi:hypothetical protein
MAARRIDRPPTESKRKLERLVTVGRDPKDPLRTSLA